MDNVLVFEWERGIKDVYPAHPMVRNWLFKEGEEDEATLAYSMAVIAEKNGLTNNDLLHIFPAVLRILKSDIVWAENINLKQRYV